ncbi:MAG: HAD-IB family phosphatase [Oligoflexia bacterium]|nr:HAD-IB family phosphatase [Oligoflexia bacterium]
MEKIALFDFDETITSKDTLVLFLRFVLGTKRFYCYLCLLSPWITLYFLGIYPNYKLKILFLRFCFRSYKVSEFKMVAKKFALSTELKQVIRENALAKIHWHKAQGHRVIVVSATLKEYLSWWCEQQQLELLATEITFSNDQMGDGFHLNNCYGEEKVQRTKLYLGISDKHPASRNHYYLYAYGDSQGDRELLAFANEGHYQLV